ncbi:SDR family oxidoreductase [Nonomuraea rubra]|uniref:SDR family oxidoreductase n=1 Tax=Nonomuraea rubra TaxID=46180 RepID=UPI003615273E
MTRDVMILVLGATGSTGRRVAEQLRAAGHAVRGASRSGQATFDWSEPGTWEPALSGASALYLMAPDGVPVDPAFVSLAVERGVERIVLLSSGAIEAMGDERLLAAERTVRDSGAEWTILRPSWFNQNFDEGFFRPAIMAGEVLIPSATYARRSSTPTTSPPSPPRPSPGRVTPGAPTTSPGPPRWPSGRPWRSSAVPSAARCATWAATRTTSPPTASPASRSTRPRRSAPSAPSATSRSPTR